MPVSEMTYTVSSGTLNSSIPYHARRMERIYSGTAIPSVFAMHLDVFPRDKSKITDLNLV